MTATDFDAERRYEDGGVSTEVFRSDRTKVVCGYFEPGQFISVHALASDVALHVQSGTGLVCDGRAEHHVESGDVVVEAETDRGVRADESSRLETLLVTAPPTSDAEHEPVRTGLRQNEFDLPREDA